MGYLRKKNVSLIILTGIALAGITYSAISVKNNQDLRSSAAVPTPTSNLMYMPISPFTSPTPTPISGSDSVSGTLQMLHSEDFKSGKSNTIYYLHTTDNKNIKLNYSGNITAKFGSIVSVTGKLSSPTILEVGTITSANFKITSAAKIAATAPTKGNSKVAVVLFNFTDTNTSLPTVAEGSNFFNTEIKNYFLENSFNQLNLTASYFGWYKLAIPKTCDWQVKIDNAAKLADQYLYYPDYSTVIFAFSGFQCPPEIYPNQAGTLNYQSATDGNISMPAITLESDYAASGSDVLAHELGHTLGAWHANGWECGSQSMSELNNCSNFEYGNNFDAMGRNYFLLNPAPQFSAYSKNLFGWLSASNVYKVSQSGTYTIYPSETQTSGVQLLQIPIPLSTFSYYIENREKIGSDSSLPAEVASGALVYFAPYDNHQNTELIDMSPNINSTDEEKYSDFGYSALAVGSTFTDPTNGISIKVLGNSGSNLSVQVTLPTSVTLQTPADNFTYHANDPAMHFSWWPNSGVNDYQLQFNYSNNPGASYYPGYYRCGSLCTNWTCPYCFYPLSSEDYVQSVCNGLNISWRVNSKNGSQISSTAPRNINCLPQVTSVPIPTSILTPIPVITGTGANVSIQIGKAAPVFLPSIPDKSAVTVTYAKDDGPVIVKSTNNTPIVVGIRERWNLNGAAKSTFQLMALPENLKGKTYFFPAYNNKTLSGQLRVANIDGAGPIASIIGIKIGSSAKPVFDLMPFESKRVTYDEDSGPVKVDSNYGYIISALRDAWSLSGQVTSFTELMGLPASLLSDTYYFPAYNNITLSGQLRIGNVDNVSTNVTVNIGGVDRGTYTLAPNQSLRPTFALDAGPVIVKSSNGAKIIAALRDAWLVNGQATSFSQMMGLPKEQAADSYYFPWYENTGAVAGQLRIGNIGSVQTDVTVTIAGTEVGRYILKPNESVRPTYPNLNKGPIEVKSTNGAKIIVAIRDAQISSSGTVTSFTQTMGLPGPQLSTSYVLPAYNNVTLDTELRIANP